MSPLEAAIVNTHPLRVPDLTHKFDKSECTIREWARLRKLKGAKKIGREWRFTLDVDYVDIAPVHPAVADAAEASLDMLRRYEVGRARAT